jgi:hypothetical protein
LSTSAPHAQLNATEEKPVGAARPAQSNAMKPVGVAGWVGWRESSLTRAMELESLYAWMRKSDQLKGYDANALEHAIACHIEASRQAAQAAKPWPRKWLRNGALLERALSNLDATEAFILRAASADYVLGQMPSLLRHVQCHLIPTDPRRQEIERIAQKLGVKDPAHPVSTNTEVDDVLDDKKERIVDNERGRIVTAVRGASSVALREQLRLRSFRNIVVLTTLLLTLLAVGVAVTGYFHKDWITLCFSPGLTGERVVVVCPTTQSVPLPADVQDIDDAVRDTATPHDLLVVELVGLTAAAVAATVAIRRLRGSAERLGLPVALAALKLPTGAITAFLGLLLMRGQFVPGLTALDTSGQIIAWALVFGYAQQLFTRLIDDQGRTVLESVRGASRPISTPSQP